MATAAAKKKTSSVAKPPEERFWKRYSPHHEAPLAGMTSIFIHGVVLGFMVFGGIAFLFRNRDEASKPVNIDVVLVSNSGSGADGPEGAMGTKGAPGDPASQEAATPASPQPPQNLPEIASPLPKVDVPKVNLDFPAAADAPMVDAKDETEATLETVRKSVEEAIKRGEKPPAPMPKAAIGALAKPAGRPGGQGGNNGRGPMGDGPGLGKKGIGIGGGGPGGKQTEADVFAWRWNFDLSGDSRQHADKIAAMGFVLAFPDPKNSDKLLVARDLRRRPVILDPTPASKFESAVKKGNTKADSVAALARELQLRFVPSMAIILIPDGLKQKMANEEARYAQQTGRNLEKVEHTWFDFRLANGAYQPFVFKME